LEMERERMVGFVVNSRTMINCTNLKQWKTMKKIFRKADKISGRRPAKLYLFL